MNSFTWIYTLIFFLGFLRGLQGDFLLDHPSGDEYPFRLSLRPALIYLGYNIFGLIIPLLLLKIALANLSPLILKIPVGIIFLIILGYSFYDLFHRPPKILHQHDHPHKHEHTHVHQESHPDLTAQDQEHIDHRHPCPGEIDQPVPLDSRHDHAHYHHHQHLHLHQEEKKQNHTHYHHQKGYKQITACGHPLLLVTLSLIILSFPLMEIPFLFITFLPGLFLSLYLLEIIYRQRGISLIGEIAHISDFFLVLISGLTGLYFMVR